MPKLPKWLLLIALIVAAAFYFHQNYEVEGLKQLSIKPRQATPVDLRPEPGSPAAESRDTIRIGSFNIQVFGTSKLAKPHVMQILCEVIRDFDIVAIQEIRSKDSTVLPQFVEQINAAGVRYDYAIGPRLGRTDSKEQYAFIFNTETIEIDRSATYTVAADNRLHRPPLVGMFRARGPPPDKAFTFRLINIHTDPDEVKQEVNALADVYRAVLNHDRQEDDVILLGDLNANESQFGELVEIPGITWALSGVMTNTRGTKSYDNMLFLARATNEYTGRSGAVDMLRRFNLDTKRLEEVSDHLPIWAEFSKYEGGNRGRVAAAPAAPTK